MLRVAQLNAQVRVCVLFYNHVGEWLRKEGGRRETSVLLSVLKGWRTLSGDFRFHYQCGLKKPGWYSAFRGKCWGEGGAECQVSTRDITPASTVEREPGFLLHAETVTVYITDPIP